MNIEELKRLAEAVVNSGDVADALAASMDFMEAVDPAAILELIRQRDELLAALREIAEWTERYTTPGHPISTAARAAMLTIIEKMES